MQFTFFLIVLIFAGAQCQNQAASQNYDERYSRVLNFENNVGLKNWESSFDTENNIHQEANGYWTGTGQAGPDGEELGINNVNGYATYYLKEGIPFTLNYNADGNGYRPHFVIGAIGPRSQANPGPSGGRQPGRFARENKN